jgi:two-component system sensor histidine kinase CreC
VQRVACLGEWLARFVVLRIFLQQVKPGTRLAMEDSLVNTASALAQLATPKMVAGTIAQGGFAQGIAVFDSHQQALGQDHSRWNDVIKTLRGEYGARSSAVNPEAADNTVMHVAEPIRDGPNIIGALTDSRVNQSLEPYIAHSVSPF